MNATEAKRRVLAVHPTAKEMYDRDFNRVIGIGIVCVIGRGKKWPEAWIAAAAGLEERNER